MPRYAITEKAGPFVAARRNTGVGMVLDLTGKQAEHEVRLGTLVAIDAPTPSETEQREPDLVFDTGEPQRPLDHDDEKPRRQER